MTPRQRGSGRGAGKVKPYVGKDTQVIVAKPEPKPDLSLNMDTVQNTYPMDLLEFCARTEGNRASGALVAGFKAHMRKFVPERGKEYPRANWEACWDMFRNSDNSAERPLPTLEHLEAKASD